MLYSLYFAYVMFLCRLCSPLGGIKESIYLSIYRIIYCIYGKLHNYITYVQCMFACSQVSKDATHIHSANLIIMLLLEQFNNVFNVCSVGQWQKNLGNK